jgi:predicted hydrocarbon binding protein
MGNDKDLAQLKKTVDALTILAGGLAVSLNEVLGEHGGAAITYNLGANAGKRIAERLGMFEKPQEAMDKLFPEIRGIFDVSVKQLTHQQNGEFSGEIETRGCFIRDVLIKRGIKAGGVLCRISRGYFETALSKMTGAKVTVRRLQSSDSNCLDSITFELGKSK